MDMANLFWRFGRSTPPKQQVLDGCPHSPPSLRRTPELPFTPSQPIDTPETQSQFNRAVSAFFHLESPSKRISLGDKLIKSFCVQNSRRAFAEEQHEAILYVKKRRSQRLAINLALSVDRVDILDCEQIEEAQTVKVEIITKMKPVKEKRAANRKRKPEEGGSSHYSANTKSAKIRLASQPLTLTSPSTTQFTHISDTPPPPSSQPTAFSTSLCLASSCSQFAQIPRD